MKLQIRRHGLTRPGPPEVGTACADVRFASADPVGAIVTPLAERDLRGWREAIHLAISIRELTQAFRRSLFGDVIAPAAESELGRSFPLASTLIRRLRDAKARPDRQAPGLSGRYRSHLETD
ncbi:hypothetical protein MTX26_28570 [Bradyrhizobium sp. ISRA443]|uniref:hypothetical protein n=1 Tax=unclassified Bradyrhizobium TaxID=2631580 RepID=UPI0024799AFA|nr:MULTISPECIES: hypothetical protein [unclassified Bradyrhizobium]WGR98182.1 hypothetical protein MTX23_28560 [Bradyrhizobium sp. ISRA436]WGS05071.1 hypothetical protein MTX18_28575 [Bradyrhizobium sp. ISRA437]WGS11956.1 hypothetical protein MTX26_28570 [Bradyrhizobium sp. ISRA443]